MLTAVRSSSRRLDHPSLATQKPQGRRGRRERARPDRLPEIKELVWGAGIVHRLRPPHALLSRSRASRRAWTLATPASAPTTSRPTPARAAAQRRGRRLRSTARRRQGRGSRQARRRPPGARGRAHRSRSRPLNAQLAERRAAASGRDRGRQGRGARVRSMLQSPTSPAAPASWPRGVVLTPTWSPESSTR